MKQAEYAAGVVSVYRKYMDRYFEYGAKDYHVSKEDMQKLYDFGNRSGFTKGYYEKHNGKDMITFQKPNHAKGNEALQEKVREDFCRGEIKEKINGNLILSQDSSAILDVTMGDLRYTACGDVVQPALKQPLSMEKVRENMEKTGNTPFEFENLTIAMRDAIFLPMKSLNQLRRDALEGLEKLCVEQFRREVEQVDYAGMKAQESTAGTPEKYLSALAEQRCQLQPLLESELVSDIYLDSGLLSQKGLVERSKRGCCKNSCSREKGILCVSICFSEKCLRFLSGIPEKTEQLFCGWSGGEESGCSLVCTQVSAADANDSGSGALYLQSQGTGNIA